MSKLRISIGPVQLHARLLDTPAADAVRRALPIASQARVRNGFVSFDAPEIGPFPGCLPAGRRAGDFVLSGEASVCGIDIRKLPFTRSGKAAGKRAADVWARAMGDIAALKHVIEGDPVAVELAD